MTAAEFPGLAKDGAIACLFLSTDGIEELRGEPWLRLATPEEERQLGNAIGEINQRHGRMVVGFIEMLSGYGKSYLPVAVLPGAPLGAIDAANALRIDSLLDKEETP